MLCAAMAQTFKTFDEWRQRKNVDAVGEGYDAWHARDAEVAALREALECVLAIENFASLDTVRYGDESIREVVLKALGR